MSEIYQRLMACPGQGDPFDRHILACVLAKAASEAPRPMTNATGLDRSELGRLIDTVFPGAADLLIDAPDGAGADAIEEPDLRRLLLDNANPTDQRVARWLAAMVARRSVEPNHLWQDLGLTGRADLSGLLQRHFRPLADKNTKDMKWKKFFYREMCEAEGMTVCKSPVCEACGDYQLCYGDEE